MIFKVKEDWHATYVNPIRFEAGEALYLTGRQDNWDGHMWLWAKAANGLEGWIPDTIVSKTNAGFVAIEDYTAAELTCRTGQVVRGEKETHGWVFCRLQDGSAGWIPRKNLTSEVG
ncbi:SH3 domain-containing protein [Roseinatronobacter alkalisoli]|uniref:SH3 domain-containing protein n=1 Tax=Roseinatronobacter alkalisoli TaxID=3028235 RepID=A0ABT5TFK5_9RHOB|nr:SH3 domain-containing protein [Roseinatronobacter sp. HJB301]MDD7973904.1 SH3 domain-containing protein [Roseinatronobacter sp. HJB301]